MIFKLIFYAGHMIRRPEELPQKALYSESNPMEREIKEDLQVGGWGEQQ
jgi:hypothetical protein